MDIQILLLFQVFREAIGGALNGFFAFVTNIAVDYYVALPALMIFWAVDKRMGAQIFASWGTSLAVGATLKTTFCVYRPWIRHPEVQPLQDVMSGATGYSFPSGHSSSSSGFYSGLFMAYRKHKGICAFAVTMVLLTMISRLYVGVHTPQDVVVGACVGVLASLLIAWAFAWVDRHPEKDWVVLAAVIAYMAFLLPYIYFKKYPMDYVDGQLLVDPAKMTIDGFKDPGRTFGIILGWWLERRFVKFDIKGTTEQKVVRCLAGGLLYVLYWTLVCDWLGKLIGIGVVHFLLQASAQVLFMTVYPMVFSRVQK